METILMAYWRCSVKNALAKLVLLIVSVCLVLVGCSTNTREQNTVAGAATGAVVGGLAGTLAHGSGAGAVIAAGAVVGAVVGGLIGHSMESSDTTRVYTVLNDNRVGQPTEWVNTRTGAHYWVVPMSEPMVIDGYQDCRKYRTTAIIKGKKRRIYGTACRQPDGTWLDITRHVAPRR